MRQALSRLPPKCREVFELRKFEGLSQRQVAERMGIAQSTVEKHLIKALRWMMSELQDSGAGEKSAAVRSHVFRRKGR
jgi:RNA polymerase sigma-70 factor (ECF subfamily)